MTSFRTSLTPNRRAATRFISGVRRALQKALVDEGKKTGLTQAEVARRIGINRSIINRELRGVENLSLGRAAELAWAMNKKPIFELVDIVAVAGSNAPLPVTAHANNRIAAGTDQTALGTYGADVANVQGTNMPSAA